MKKEPLRYSIDSWYDLTRCKSNNSKYLKIFVEDIIDEDKLCGLVITVRHFKYGTLFAHVVNGSGELLTLDGTRPHEFSIDEILKELHKFGFEVEFSPELHLSSSMITYLNTLLGLNYDKLRMISIPQTVVWGTDQTEYTDYVVAFSPDKLPKWLDNLYSPTKSEFSEAMLNGYACNVSMSPEGEKLDWSWLKTVLNISDILDSNYIVED